MDISWIKFIFISLAIFRLTRLIVFDQITAFIRAPFLKEYEETNNNGEKEIFLVPRENGLRGWIGELISCYWCTGIWIAAIVVFFQWKFPVIVDPILLVFGFAGMAAIIETIIQNLIQD